MTPTVNSEISEKLNLWKEKCRSNLLELEKKSINVRVSVFEKILNEKTSQVNRMLCINDDNIDLYKHYTDITQHIKFIKNWNGLNTNQMRTLPKSLNEYENRAKNWLNGRRAINYASSLFPEMILCSEHYAKLISSKIFTNNNKLKLYYHILLYSYITGILSGRVALYDGHHRASLICENSIKKEGNLKRLLQKYYHSDGGNDIDVYIFPKHLQSAIDYFKNKYHTKLNEFQSKYIHKIQTKTKTNCDNNKLHGCTDDNKSSSTDINIESVDLSTVTGTGSDHAGSGSRSHYGPSRGGNYIGMSMNCRNNPLARSNSNSNISVIQNQYQNKLNNMNIMNMKQRHLLNNHSNTISNLIIKMNQLKQRNSFLEQEVYQYRRQASLDCDKIKLLEEQITLLQNNSINNIYYDEPPVPQLYSNISCNTTASSNTGNQSQSSHSTCTPPIINNNGSNNNNNGYMMYNDNVSDMPINNCNMSGIMNSNMSGNMNGDMTGNTNGNNNCNINGMNTVDRNNNNMDNMSMFNNMNNMNNMSMNNNRNTNMNNIPINSNKNNNPSLFGPIGTATGEYDIDTILNNNFQ